jgi:ribosomal protein L29
MILQENKMSDLNIRNNKLTKENIDFKSKIELLNNSIKIKDDTIKSKDNDIRQLTIAANNYKQELVSIKQQLAAKPNPMELNALRQRLADIK